MTTSTTSSSLSLDQIAAAALAALPKIGPKRLMTLLKHHDPQTAWAVVQGRAKPDQVVEAMLHANGLQAILRAQACTELQDQIVLRCKKSAIRVAIIGEKNYPAVLQHDIAPPAVLFYQGDLSALSSRRVGMIGTRSATASGRYLAAHIAHQLASCEICIVSGLARGIDAWAHRGALRAHEQTTPDKTHVGRPVGVVASGLDYVYPKENAQLWSDVAKHGALLSESAPGAPPEAFRFPLRNRILAALSEVVLVVESRATGGSMITVDEALRRDIAVLAVPGSPHNIASDGTNLLVQQGCLPIVNADDVLVALGLDHRRDQQKVFDPREKLGAVDARLVAQMGGSPFTLDQLVTQMHMPLLEAAITLGRLQAWGWVVETAGWWEVIEIG